MKLITELEVIIANSEDNKLKDNKEALIGFESMLKGYKAETIKACYDTAMKARTRKVFVDAVTSIIDDIKGLEPNKDKEVEMSGLPALASSINESLASAQKSFFHIGKCLNEALAIIKKDGGKQKDFIGWSQAKCGIRKAQAYKLMKVYNVFGEQSNFAGTSMRVLYTLSNQPEEIIKEAETMAIAGTLDSASLNDLLDSKQPTPKESEITETPKGKEVEKAKGKDFNNKLELENAKLLKELNDLKAKDKGDDSETVTALKETIESLNETIDNLQKELEEKKVKKVLPQIESLPQFASSCMVTRIGLELEKANDKKAINKAYRGLAKIFTATACPKGSEAIKEARESLLNAIK